MGVGVRVVCGVRVCGVCEGVCGWMGVCLVHTVFAQDFVSR